MNTATSHGKNESNRVVSSDKSSEIPWLRLRARIREALTQRNYYVASSEDLGLLWSGERVDATERRRRITVFRRATSMARRGPGRWQHGPLPGGPRPPASARS